MANLSEINSKAHQLRAKNQTNWKTAFNAANLQTQITQALNEGKTVSFVFIKKGGKEAGQERICLAQKLPDTGKSQSEAGKARAKNNPQIIYFYDLNRKAIRSCDSTTIKLDSIVVL